MAHRRHHGRGLSSRPCHDSAARSRSSSPPSSPRAAREATTLRGRPRAPTPAPHRRRAEQREDHLARRAHQHRPLGGVPGARARRGRSADQLLRLRRLGRGPSPEGCDAAAGAKLPDRNGPAPRAAPGRRRDSPTRTVPAGRPSGPPIEPELEVPLSDFVSGLDVRHGHLPRDVAPRSRAARPWRRRTRSRSPGPSSDRRQGRPNATSSGVTPPARGAPAPKRTRSPITAGHAFTPARIRIRQASFPSAAANA